MTDLLECEICGYRAKTDWTVVRICADGIIRCRICRDKIKYGRYVRDEDKIKGKCPPVLHDYKSWMEELDAQEAV